MVEEVKGDILKFMANMKMVAGNVLPGGAFNNYILTEFTPEKQQVVTSALNSLVAEGILTNKYSLTDLGYQHVYPSSTDTVIKEVSEDILDFLSEFKVETGNTFPEQSYLMTRVSNYSPQQERVINQAFSGLVQSGLLDQRSGNYILTQAGYDYIHSR